MRALRGAGAEALAVLETCAGEARARALTLERGLLTLELGQSEKAERLLRLADVRKPRIGASTRPWAPHLPPVASSKRPRSSSAEPWPWRPTTRACSATLPSPWRSTARPRKPRRCCARRGCPARRRLKWRRILALVLGLRDRFDEAKLAAAALPAGKGTANVAYLQALRGAKTADAGTESRALNAGLGLSFQLGGAN